MTRPIHSRARDLCAAVDDFVALIAERLALNRRVGFGTRRLADTQAQPGNVLVRN